VRRFLEHHGTEVDSVIFCMDTDDDLSLYSKVLPLYFPRNTIEQERARDLLPEDTGNEFGETVIEERKIRIAETVINKSFEDEDNSEAFGTTSIAGNEFNHKGLLTAMEGDPDEKKNKICSK